MSRHLGWLLALLSMSCNACLIWGQTSFPMVTHAFPVAVQRGTTAELIVAGQQNFAGAYKVLVSGNDLVRGEIVVPANQPRSTPAQRMTTVTVKFNVDKDAEPGVREFRIATDAGLSSVGLLLITDDPVFRDTSNPREIKPIGITIPTVVCGRLAVPEQVTTYEFDAVAGQRLTCEVYCARLEDKIHDLQNHADPAITLFDGQGKELTGNDDYCFADPKLSYEIKVSGKYRLQIRDSKFEGDPRWVYAIRITQLPDASHVFPMAHAPGSETQVELIGPGTTLKQRGRIKIPGSASRGELLAPTQVNQQPIWPAPVWVSELPIRTPMETEWAKGIHLEIPCCINGRIAQPRQQHEMRFQAKAGQAIRFELIARRFPTALYSGLDGLIEILDEQGRVLVRGDDLTPAVKDPMLIFNPPRNGSYVLRLRDLHGKGGPHYVYSLEVTYPQPDFVLRCDGDLAMIGPGTRIPWYVQVERLNGFADAIDVKVEGLPAGVSASPCVIPASMTQGVIILTASANAKMGAAPVNVIGTALTKRSTNESLLSRKAIPMAEIYLPGGGRGLMDVSLHALAVTEASDIQNVQVTPQTITLKPGQEVKILIKLDRHPRAKDANVTLDVKLRHLGRIYADPLPPGLIMVDGQSKTLLGKGNDGYIILRAAPNAAPIKDVSICVVASVSVNFVVKVAYASPAIPVTIEGK